MQTYPRRTFIRFLGKAAAGSILLPPLLQACAGNGTGEKAAEQALKGIAPSMKDDLVLAEGLSYSILASWGDGIKDELKFGFNNDYTAFLPGPFASSGEGLLWVNHEYVDPFFVSGYVKDKERTKDQVLKEQKEVGGSLIHVRKENGTWKMVPDSPHNFRVDATTEIPFSGDYTINGAEKAVGTLANCAGGVTPWGTVLTCEENYDLFYGETDYSGGDSAHIESTYGWEKFFSNPPEHYGWVVEIDPISGKATKHPSMGRFAHESATVRELTDRRVVVYSGDDANNECLYKFISNHPEDLSEGTLYVADLENGQWIPLDRNQKQVLKDNFKDQQEVMVRCREAAHLVGGTPLDRPEDIAIDSASGNVFVALTNNKPQGNYFGSIMKLDEKDNDPAALSFTYDTFLTGGEDTGFACPDNLVFDNEGNLWFTTDMSGMHSDPYKPFKNNGLFVVLRSGKREGEVLQVASAPVGAELTGPTFSPDEQTLFLSVQHPGEGSGPDGLTSHWPDGKKSMPRPSVVAITFNQPW